ncbi:MAG: sulfatase-like hydrolase/transferase [Chloroflexi bacterium]|nr:sulfatase-like hydrolase/transferase [Chloroflexota bacterium]
MTQQPNILFIMTDQQRSDTIGALGNRQIRTPTLDSLVENGIAFSNCYTPSPVCVAARSATITGLPPHLNGCTSNNESPLGLQSIMQVLGAQGYRTHGIAKMHFNPQVDALWGFDSRDISEEGARGPRSRNDFHNYLSRHGFDHVLEPQGLRSEMYYIPQPSQLPAAHHHSTWVADRAIDFLAERDRSQPFFLWASFIKPHPPFEAPTPWNKLYRAADMLPPHRPEGFEDLLAYWNHHQNRYKYRDKGYDQMLFRTMKAMYYACISFIDFSVGRILEALGDDIDNTLIVFTADHGELLGDYGSVGKRSMLNPAAKVPLIVKAPERSLAGRRIDTPVSLLDIFPTFATAASADVPPPSPEGADLLAIASGAVQRDAVFSQLSEGNTGLYMIAERDLKFIYSAADQKEWLFDLRVDPTETVNWAGNPRYAERLSKLRSRLIERFENDGYDSAVENGAWREYDPPAFPDPARDDGLLFQDPPHLPDLLRALGPGYAP